MLPPALTLPGWPALILLTSLFGLMECLTCWHCIAENCDLDPASNFRAEKRQCMEGHLCQKVYFEMQSDIDDARYKSTVRSCAEQCEPRDDYQNCTRDLYITRGCVRRMCCHNNDLCNSAPKWTSASVVLVMLMAGSSVWLGAGVLLDLLKTEESHLDMKEIRGPVAAEKLICQYDKDFRSTPTPESDEIKEPGAELREYYIFSLSGTIGKLRHSVYEKKATHIRVTGMLFPSPILSPGLVHDHGKFQHEIFDQKSCDSRRNCTGQCRSRSTAYENMAQSLRFASVDRLSPARRSIYGQKLGGVLN